MSSADVVIVGGGVNGASTAFFLARAGVSRVILLERRQLGAGASGKSGALIRMHYSNPVESKLAHESLKVFRNWSEIISGDCGFEGTGFIQVVPAEYEEQLRANVAAQQALGIDTRVITAEELKEIEPAARVDDLTVAAYEPGSGFADPNATLYGFASAAKRFGVEVRTDVEVTRVLAEQGRVTGVQTGAGRIDTEMVVLATGAWSQRLLDPLGLNFGLEPRRVQVAVFRWPPELDHSHPVFIDATQGAWFRPEGPAGTLVGLELGVSGVDPDDLREGVDQDYVELCRRALTARMPAFRAATMRGGWAGMITMSPDGRPIIDQIPQVPGLFCMLGDSGTSFKTSPAIGMCLSEWITEGRPRTVDLHPFRSTRFAEGEPWRDQFTYGEDMLTISR